MLENMNCRNQLGQNTTGHGSGGLLVAFTCFKSLPLDVGRIIILAAAWSDIDTAKALALVSKQVEYWRVFSVV